MKPRRFDDLRAPAVQQPATGIPKHVLVAFQKTFATPDGEMVLDYLRAMTTRTAHGPDVSDSALRHFEGQRFLVRRIEDLADPDRKHENSVA
jgi:hypothetical protein